MRDWVVLLLVGLASLGIICWVLRLRSPMADASARGERVRSDADIGDRITSRTAGPSASGRSPHGSVPNTSVAPHPDDLPVAVLEFDGPPGRVPIRRGETVIGRHSDDDVRVPDVRVSRHHARLVAQSGSFELHNLTAVRSEPNPMLINGEDREHARIADGDVITLGGVSFTFRLAAA